MDKDHAQPWTMEIFLFLKSHICEKYLITDRFLNFMVSAPCPKVCFFLFTSSNIVILLNGLKTNNLFV